MAPRVLVGLQFFAIGVLLLPLGAAGWVWTGFAVALAGLMGVAWTVGYNRWGNFNIRPIHEVTEYNLKSHLLVANRLNQITDFDQLVGRQGPLE